MSDKEQMKVVIDSREPGDVHGFVLRHEDVKGIETIQLESADLIVGGVGFERKTPEDFAASVMGEERNVYDQAERMCESYDACYILVEGSVRDFENLEHTNIPPKALRGAAASLTARYCPVIFCGAGYDDERDSADLERLVDMAMRIGRKHNESSTHTFMKGSAADSDVSVTQRCFGCIEGVGPTLAETLEGEFGSISEASRASIERLMELDGVGAMKAETIYRSLQGEYDE